MGYFMLRAPWILQLYYVAFPCMRIMSGLNINCPPMNITICVCTLSFIQNVAITKCQTFPKFFTEKMRVYLIIVKIRELLHLFISHRHATRETDERTDLSFAKVVAFYRKYFSVNTYVADISVCSFELFLKY